jgi:lipopolysaccharide transport system permease protein
VTRILPPHGWQWINFGELWQSRELVGFLTWREVKVRYKQTLLGAAWAILQPLLMMVVFTIFFGRLARLPSGDLPYPLFALAGLIPWTFFSNALASAANSVVGSERLITKIYFPRLAVPFAAVGAAAIDFGVAMLLMGLVMAGYGHAPSANILLAPLIFAVMLLAAAGLGTMLAALNVAYRDFRYVVPFFIQLGMFATPTIYFQPTGNEGRSIGWLMSTNPMTSLISGFRASLLGGEIPWAGLGVATILAVALFVIGCLYFRKVEDRFADVI